MRFPFEHKKDMIMLVMNSGELYICDCQSDDYIRFEHEAAYLAEERSDSDDNITIHECAMGRLRPSVIMDYEKGYILSVGEDG